MDHLKPAVFIDRDGTICEEKNYLSTPEDLVLIPHAAEALKRLNDAGMYVIVLTNQSGIARGFFSEETLERIHEHLGALLMAEGARMDAVYFCPHHSEKGRPPYNVDCDCRKPGTGMVRQACDAFPIDLSRSCVIGDKLSDTQMGMKLKMLSILVQTGYGAESALTGIPGQDFSCTALSLQEAVDCFLKNDQQKRNL